MIINDEQLTIAKQGVHSLQKVLMKARKHHSPQEYRAMSEPILLELQQRDYEILQYLAKPE